MATRSRGKPVGVAVVTGVLASLLVGVLASGASAQAGWRGAYDEDGGYAAPGWRAAPDGPAYDDGTPVYRVRPGWTYRERTYYRRVYRYRTWPQDDWPDESVVAVPPGRDTELPVAPWRGRTPTGAGDDSAYQDGREAPPLGEASRRPRRQSRPVRLPVARPVTAPAPSRATTARAAPPATPAASPQTATRPATASDPAVVAAAGAPVALPVPRPNLEGLDFAPATPPARAAAERVVPDAKAL